MSPAPDERNRIRAAMDRILNGTATRSTGALTIVALAMEADVPRNALTQRHPDLRNDFYNQVRVRGQTPDSERRLRRQITRLKELRTADAQELADLRADREALIGALHQVQMENRRLRQQTNQGLRLMPRPGPDTSPPGLKTK
ncbi:hypothetical protein [Streptomyces flavidovirens]|uniref:hypothetical protein n=1 Tax=Streptomyces flavidovirens TaxID=67298 RepID=UPI0036906F2C